MLTELVTITQCNTIGGGAAPYEGENMSIQVDNPAELIGGQYLLEVDKLRFPVVVLQTRVAYGRDDVLVAPVNGKGQKWVVLNRIISQPTN